MTAPPSITDDVRAAWEERAAILEYDANMPREQAEIFAAALYDLDVNDMRSQTP